jgi:hypothetical protein
MLVIGYGHKDTTAGVPVSEGASVLPIAIGAAGPGRFGSG